MSKNYVYVGQGAGVPGLPHEISTEEAEEQGVEKLLQAAIKNGNYREAAPAKAGKQSSSGSPRSAEEREQGGEQDLKEA